MRKLIFAFGFALALGFTSKAENPAPSFKEVYDLLKTNLTGITDAELNRAAVLGLIEQLQPRVSLAGEPGDPSGKSGQKTTFRSSVFEKDFGYFRLGNLGADARRSFEDAYRQITTTNRLKGIVLDLRYSDGQDYKVAADLADRFVGREEPLIDWGRGAVKSEAKTNAIELPTAILVNQSTSGAAEALAGILRQMQIALIIGTNTAGNAAIARDLALSTGQHLRVAASPVKFGDGTPFPSTGLKPDIYVEVSPDDEQVWFDDSFKVLSKPMVRASTLGTNDLANTSTNRGPRRRLNEAELVRMLREGINPEAEGGNGAREVERAKGLVSDPVLARALDLLKGLTVVQQFRSS